MSEIKYDAAYDVVVIGAGSAASVMPAMPSPNIHPATIMVAEKSSDIIGRSLAN